MTTLTNPVKAIQVIEKKTGVVKTAIYAANRMGNLRMAVDGKFYSDKDFMSKFKSNEKK
jgi:hypothetical protein